MTEDYVVVKLVTGDQLIAKCLNHTDNGVLILRPITVKLVPVMSDGEVIERMLTSVYCPVSDQESFIIDTRNVIFVNRLHPSMIDHYNQLSDSLYESLKDPNRFQHADPKNDEPEEPVSKPDNIVYH